MAYKQRWLKYFDALDVDGSGFIDPADLEQGKKIFTAAFKKPYDSPEVQIAVAGYQTMFSGIMRDFDLNHDGKVTREELLQGVEKCFIGKTPEEAPDWWKAGTGGLVEAADTHKTGEVSLEIAKVLYQGADPTLTDKDVTAAVEFFKKHSPAGKKKRRKEEKKKRRKGRK